MDLLKMHKRRSRLSEVAYVVLNIGLAAVVFAIVYTANSPWLAIAAVLLIIKSNIELFNRGVACP